MFLGFRGGAPRDLPPRSDDVKSRGHATKETNLWIGAIGGKPGRPTLSPSTEGIPPPAISKEERTMEKAKKICELKLNETEAVVGGAVSIATMPVSKPAGTTTQA
jgi:hypothetical protein